MVTPPDPVVLHVDIIAVDPRPLAAGAAQDRPGFYLDDDAGGRFVVDPEFGVISLRDEAVLAAERGRVHSVRLRVVESTGDHYMLDLKLRITGMVPQMLGAEEFDFGADHAAPAPATPWSGFAAACGLQTKAALPSTGAYGALLSAPLPATQQRIALAFGEKLPGAAAPHTAWSL